MNDIEIVQTTMVQFDKVAAGIAALKEKHGGVVFEVATTSGMEAAKEARREVREPRLEVERLRKAAKAPLLAIGKRLDTEAARITAELEKIEGPVDVQIKNEESRRETERQRKIDEEVARQAAIQALVDKLRNLPIAATGKSSAEVDELLQSATEYVITEADFAERAPEARQVLMVTVHALQGILTERLKHEAEQKQLEADRAELAQRRRDDEARRIEAEAKETAKREADRKAQQELDRVERETQEANRQRNEMAMQELQAIHHQLLIADTGRAPYCKGGDLASIDYALKGTEDWRLTEERFGHLYQSAVKAKETVIATLRQKRADFIKRHDDVRAAAERQKELDAQKEANDARAEEQRARDAEETGRITAAREALARDQAEAQRRQEEANKPKQSKSEQKRVAAMKGYPTRAELLDGVAAHFKTDADTARGWLSFYDWKAADERKSA